MLAVDVVDPETGEVIAEAGQELTDTLRKKLSKAGSTRSRCCCLAAASESPLIKNTLAKDPTHSEDEALEQIYALLRPGDAPNLETARQALERLFFSPKRYDLGRVGRYKINQRLELKTDREPHGPHRRKTSSRSSATSIELHEGRGYTDDIDHLGNRRIRSVGELIANQFSVGLSRMARLVKERMSINTDPEKISLDDLVNARTVCAVIQAFFGSSQLSQFMDQTNPLAELTHKRRLSALGPGGLTRERAGFEVRDVHYSQYGRMCPIETPEGPNIGLITSLASTYARVNDLGFIETPYRVVKNGKVTDEIAWLDANRRRGRRHRAGERAAQRRRHLRRASSCSAASGGDVPARCRRTGSTTWTWRRSSSSPSRRRSFRSSSTTTPTARSWARTCSARRCRSSIPQTPLVGTGLEEKVARDSGAVVIARRAGVGHARHRRRDHRRRRAATAPRSWPTSRWRACTSTTATGSRSTGAPTRTPRSTSARWCSSARR